MRKQAATFETSTKLLQLVSSTIQNIDSRLSTVSDVVHHNMDSKSQENKLMPQVPARRGAAPAPAASRRPAAKPADDFDDFGDLDDMGGDLEEAPAPRGRGATRAAAPADDFDDFGEVEGVEGEATDAEDDGEFAADGEGDLGEDAEFGEGDLGEDGEDGEEPVEEVVELSPKLKNGEYILPKGAKAWYVVGSDDGGWKRDKTAVDTTRNVKLVYSKKDHNYPVDGVEDKAGKTYVVLAFGKDYLVVTAAEQLLDAATKKPAKILQPKPVEEASAPRGRGRAAAADDELDSGVELNKEQIVALKKLKAATAEVFATFGV